MALGLTLTMAVVRLPNFAHAELITVGAYVALVVSVGVSTSVPVILVLACAGSALVALLAHRTVYRPLARLNLSTYAMILASFAVGLILRYVMFLLVDRFDYFDKPIRVAQQVLLRTPNLILTNVFFWSVPTALLLMVALSFVINRTGIGRQMRALADNTILSRVIGIPVDRVQGIFARENGQGAFFTVEAPAALAPVAGGTVAAGADTDPPKPPAAGKTKLKLIK